MKHGQELFAEQLERWALDRALPDESPIKAAVRIAKRQIEIDVITKRVPTSVRSFSELHDYVDANYYGDAFEWPELPCEVDDEIYQCAHLYFWNEVQNRVHAWLAAGSLCRLARSTSTVKFR